MQAILKFSDGFVRLMDIHSWEDPKGDGEEFEVPGHLIIGHLDRRVTLTFKKLISSNGLKRAEYVECESLKRK